MDFLPHLRAGQQRLLDKMGALLGEDKWAFRGQPDGGSEEGGLRVNWEGESGNYSQEQSNMSLQRMVVMEQERRDQPRIAFLKKKKKKPSELARAGQRWRKERRGEGDALASTFLPILYLVGNVETQAGLSWEC